MDTIISLIPLLLMLVALAGLWKAFVKSGAPGWACIVPFYNLWIMVKMAGKPPLWFILCFIPIVGIIIAILLSIAIAERFGKGAGFGVGLALLGFIFWPMLGFGSAEWQAEPVS